MSRYKFSPERMLTEFIGVRLGPAERAALERLVAINRRPVSALMRKIIAEWTEQQEARAAAGRPPVSLDPAARDRLVELVAPFDSANEGERTNAITAAGALLKRHGMSMVDLPQIMGPDSDPHEVVGRMVELAKAKIEIATMTMQLVDAQR
jgi:hypothetical protein